VQLLLVSRIRRAALLVPAAALMLHPVSAAAQAAPWRQYATPAEAGFSAAGLEAARQYADSVRSGAVMAIYRGHVLVAWGDVSRELQLHSVRKSLVSALYGIAVGEGKVDLDRTLGELGIRDREPLTAGEKRARLRDVIAARSGVYLPASYAGAEQDRERPARDAHPPGTNFFYNNWDFNVAGVIYEQVTREPLYDAFLRRIAQPLGMEDYTPEDGFLVYEPSQSDHPAHTFRMSARDLARFGQLFVQRGAWNGRQIVPESWVRESTQPHTDFGGGRGYGYMWWTYAAGALGESYPALKRHDAVAGTGTGGQFVLVVPAADLVFVHRGDTDNGREVVGRDAWRIAELILSAREGEPVASPRLVPLAPVALASQAPPVPAPVYVRPSAALMREYAGSYELAPQQVVRVFVHADHLFINVPGQGEAELLGLSDSEFTIMPVAGVRVRFVRDAAGAVASVIMVLGGREMRAQRLAG
jgi:CubicO group peptidase (beta-lactamase class C family)